MARFPISEGLAGSLLRLWEGGAPLARGSAEDDVPAVLPFLPERPLGPALLLIPGGGYMEHAFDEAGIALAEHFRARGTAVFMLRYRLAADGYRYPAPLLDAQRAMRLIRARAARWGLDPAQVVAMGFSAGGHLAGLLTTQAALGDPGAAAPIERESSRPDVAVLVYPLISFVGNPRSAGNLLGPEPDAELLRVISLETQVSSRTPPTLLVHGVDDKIVGVEHSRKMFAALQAAGVPSDYHEYPVGKHGFGCWKNDPCPEGWLERVEAWCQSQGVAI